MCMDVAPLSGPSGGSDPALDRAAFPVDPLQFDEAQKVAAMVHTVARAFPEGRRVSLI